MDAYLPVLDTIKPCISSPAVDEPWRACSGTRTLFWYKSPSQVQRVGRSSLDREIASFVIVEAPVHAGLERLRSFGGWQDNWDAEGSRAPEIGVLDFASKVFGLLSIHRAPEVTLSADGHPMFIYGAPLDGEVVVTGINTIDYFFADDASPDGEDVALDESGLPADLLDYLRTA